MKKDLILVYRGCAQNEIPCPPADVRTGNKPGGKIPVDLRGTSMGRTSVGGMMMGRNIVGRKMVVRVGKVAVGGVTVGGVGDCGRSDRAVVTRGSRVQSGPRARTYM